MRRILLCAAVLFAAIQLLASPVDVRTAQAKAQILFSRNCMLVN